MLLLCIMRSAVGALKNDGRSLVFTFPFFLKLFLFSFVCTVSFLLFEFRSDISSLTSSLTVNRVVVYDTFSYSFDSDFNQDFFKDEIKRKLSGVEFNGKRRFKFSDNESDLVFSGKKKDGFVEIFSTDYIPVGHFYSLVRNVTLSDVRRKVFVLDDLVLSSLSASGFSSVQKVGSKEELISLLENDLDAIGFVKFGDLDRRLKVLSFDGNYYLDSDTGAFSVGLYVLGHNDCAVDVLRGFLSGSDSGVFERGALVKLNMGGVVAMARRLMSKMVSVGSSTYPADVIGDFLADADLTHVSNEVSFSTGCVNQSGLRFCSKDTFIDALVKSGVDIVELTGNHNNDFGSGNSAFSINLYKEKGIDYFGGGLNTVDASKILYEEVKGIKLAFVGYNYYDSVYNHVYALAGESSAGANSYSGEKLERDIKEASSNADVVIVTFQFQECYCYPSGDVIYPICYKPLANPDQKGVFRRAVELGADIVVGTQAHQPQTYELYGNGVIFYGLGNLFFDQDNWIGTRQGLILSNYFYDGKLLQSRLSATYMGSDLQPRLATDGEADLLFNLLNEARD